MNLNEFAETKQTFFVTLKKNKKLILQKVLKFYITKLKKDIQEDEELQPNHINRLRNIDRTMATVSFAQNYCSLRLYSSHSFTDSLGSSYPSQFLEQVRPRNRSSQFQPYDKFYTTINGSIKCIADVVYQEVGEGINNEQMNQANFNYWIEQNPQILDTFSKWLRTHIWSDVPGLEDFARCQTSLRVVSSHLPRFFSDLDLQ